VLSLAVPPMLLAQADEVAERANLCTHLAAVAHSRYWHRASVDYLPNIRCAS
jgi:hypothetical protein